jgi:hypothetical protein
LIEFENHPQYRRPTANSTFKKPKPDQVKIPLLINGTQNGSFLARKSSNIAIMPMNGEKGRLSVMLMNPAARKSTDKELANAAIPDFGGNILKMEPTQKLLFAIIVGHLVMPKKNPILIEDPHLLLDMVRLNYQANFHN